MSIDSHFLEQLERERTWDDRPLPPLLVDRVKRCYARHRFLTQQIYDLEKARRAAMRSGEGPISDKVRQLRQLRGIGINSSWLFVMEFFGLAGVQQSSGSRLASRPDTDAL